MRTTDPSPQPPYRGLLRWMDGAPSWLELLGMCGLFFGAIALLLIARALFGNWWRSQRYGLDSSSRFLVIGLVPLAAACGMGWWLWVLLEGIATRMSVTVLGLVVMLANEVRSGGRRRRR